MVSTSCVLVDSRHLPVYCNVIISRHNTCSQVIDIGHNLYAEYDKQQAGRAGTECHDVAEGGGQIDQGEHRAGQVEAG